MIVEDDADLREAICVTLELHQIAHIAFEDAESAMLALGEREFSMIVSDFKLPGMDGMTLLRSIHKKAPQLPVVIMTAFAEARLAVEALQSGARDFLIKPFQPEHLVGVIARYQPAAQLAPAGESASALVARSPTTLAVLSRCQRVATTNATVLLTGESGVGKDVFARQVHARSPRAGKPYVAINCAAIPETLLESTLFGFERGAFTGANKAQEGKFETANGGTLFLDEIGEMPIELQAKLLRVIQDRVVERIGSNRSQEIDVRIIAATNRDLLERVSAGRFREDLYYRLAVFPIAIPPLRERPEDILPMAELFLDRYGQTMGRPGLSLSSAARKALESHTWPGNVRELENAIQRALLLCDGACIEPDDLELRQTASPAPASVTSTIAGAAVSLNEAPAQQNLTPGDKATVNSKAGESLPNWSMTDAETGPEIAYISTNPGADLETVEREHILRVLKSTGGNRKRTIEILGISERALRYKLKDYRERGFYSDKD